MSLNPFHADPTIPARLQAYPGTPALLEQAAALLQDLVLPAADAARLITRHALHDLSDLMLLLLPLAQARARPPISHFHVGAVGLDSAGDLILGHNVEFPGTHLALTLHGEGFVATRAFHRGTRLVQIALTEAHPCAHCRQFLSEFAGADALTLIDPLGHRLTLAQLYPWPFDPAYLGQPGAVAGSVPWPNLTGAPPALLQAGQRAHTPYGGCPSAVLLTLTDGAQITGSAIESVAFNPGITPLQAAVVELLARGHAYTDIRAATLAQGQGPVNLARSTADLLAQIAPDAPLTVTGFPT